MFRRCKLLAESCCVGTRSAWCIFSLCLSLRRDQVSVITEHRSLGCPLVTCTRARNPFNRTPFVNIYQHICVVSQRVFFKQTKSNGTVHIWGENLSSSSSKFNLGFRNRPVLYLQKRSCKVNSFKNMRRNSNPAIFSSRLHDYKLSFQLQLMCPSLAQPLGSCKTPRNYLDCNGTWKLNLTATIERRLLLLYYQCH